MHPRVCRLTPIAHFRLVSWLKIASLYYLCNIVKVGVDGVHWCVLNPTLYYTVHRPLINYAVIVSTVIAPSRALRNVCYA